MDANKISELKAAVREHQAEHRQLNDLEKSAAAVWNLYQSYVSVGFTEEQSLRLVICNVQSAMRR